MNVPAFAAVSATLDLAERDKTAWPFGGLINAVLRRPVRSRPRDSADDAVPAWLLARWRAAYGQQQADAVPCCWPPSRLPI